MKKLTIFMLSVILLVSGVQTAFSQTEDVVANEEIASHAAQYSVDLGHSTVGFAVKHLGVGTTRGGFTNYTGMIQFNPDDYSSFNAELIIQATSIDTNLEGRDNHLRSADFFDVENYPTMVFKSGRLEKRGEGTVIVGDLTMKGVTKTLTIPVTVSGPVQSPSGDTVIGIAGQTQLNRQEFNITWSKNLDNGGLVVDDMVNVIIEIEAKKIVK